MQRLNGTLRRAYLSTCDLPVLAGHRRTNTHHVVPERPMQPACADPRLRGRKNQQPPHPARRAPPRFPATALVKCTRYGQAPAVAGR
ncbi:hypothetical protein VTH82DRAFT_2592 [Thermothelomyces myriococcoides]